MAKKVKQVFVQESQLRKKEKKCAAASLTRLSSSASSRGRT